MDDARIQAIVAEVVRRIGTAPATGPVISTPKFSAGRSGLFDDVDSAVQAAHVAYEQLHKVPVHVRQRAIDNMRQVTLAHLEEMAKRAVEETGLGRVVDKIEKNRLVALKTPGMEILQPSAYTGDSGLTLDEYGPLGVIGSITPTTNATETILNNAISMIAGGNTVVFNVHPSAKRTLAWYVQLLNQACAAAGAPDNLMTMVTEPSIESANQVMKHQGIRLIAVTGGGPVVKAALNSGKRAVCAGPGNPPVVVDETADLDHAARSIIQGASYDNNLLCIGEKEVFVVASVADKLMDALRRAGAVQLHAKQIELLADKAFVFPQGKGAGCPHPVVNRDLVGRDAAVLAKAIGIDVPASTQLLFGETKADHIFVDEEQMMPFIPIVRVPDVETAIAEAIKAEHGYKHTGIMHSQNDILGTTHICQPVVDNHHFW